MTPNQEIDPRIENKLHALIETKSRNPERENQGRSAFLDEAEKMALGVSQMAINRHNNKEKENPSLYRFSLKEKKPMLSTLTAIILAISILLGGSGLSVAAAQSSLPDGFLYKLKLLSEEVYMDLTAEPQAQFQIALELIDRRGEEINLLIEAGDDLTAETTNRFREQIEQTIRLALNLPEDQVVPAFEQIQYRLAGQLETMTQLQLAGLGVQTEVMLQTQAMIHERIQLLENGQGNILQLQEQLRIQEQLSNPGTGNFECTPGPMNTEAPGMGNENPGEQNSESQEPGFGSEVSGSPQISGTPGFDNEECVNCSYQQTTKTVTPPGGGNGGGARR